MKRSGKSRLTGKPISGRGQSQPELKAVKTAEEYFLSKFGNKITATESWVIVFAEEYAKLRLANQFSQPKEEQPEKIVSELEEQLEEAKKHSKQWCDKAMEAAEQRRQIQLENTRQSKEIEELKSEVEKAKELISELVRLKRIKDNVGKTLEYTECMPIAWGKSIEFLEGTKTKE
jgi:hypothetical protein